MNIILNLAIDSMQSLQFITESKSIRDMDLYNNFFAIWLNQNNYLIKIHGFAVGDDLYDFIEHIEKCINNQAKIPFELGKDVDLGFLWNEHIQKIILAQESGNPLKSWNWAGDNLLFFANRGDGFNSSMTFLYNDEFNNIVLEVCSAYPWFFGDDPLPNEYISYNDWLCEYKIIYKSIIPQHIAKQWVEELIVLYEKLDENMPFNK